MKIIKRLIEGFRYRSTLRSLFDRDYYHGSLLHFYEGRKPHPLSTRHFICGNIRRWPLPSSIRCFTTCCPMVAHAFLRATSRLFGTHGHALARVGTWHAKVRALQNIL